MLKQEEAHDIFVALAFDARYKATKYREILLDDIASVFKRNQEATR